MLRAVNVRKDYLTKNMGKKHRFEALSPTSMEVEQNKISVLIGESGSGKSTMARILSYIEAPSFGEVYLDDICITGLSANKIRTLRSQVQLIMQDASSSLDPRQTISEILDEPLKLLLHMPSQERQDYKIQLLDKVKLSYEVLLKYPSELSGGQQKRACIARALATKPRYIIFDESFSGLDNLLRKQILELLLELKNEMKIGYLVITHDLDTAMYLADIIHVMKKGKIVETINEPRAFSDFKSTYAKELIKALLSKRQAFNKS